MLWEQELGVRLVTLWIWGSTVLPVLEDDSSISSVLEKPITLTDAERFLTGLGDEGCKVLSRGCTLAGASSAMAWVKEGMTVLSRGGTGFGPSGTLGSSQAWETSS